MGARGFVGRWGATAGPRAPVFCTAGERAARGRPAVSKSGLWHLLAIPLVACLSGCIQIELLGGQRAPLTETVVFTHGEGEGRSARFVMIEVDGLIGLDPEVNLLGQPRESMVARIREQLDRARADSAVDGILLRVDSPGGSATASDVIYTELSRFKRDEKAPIVAHLLGTAASGGYYVAMAADEIVAEPTTVTGSIGVIFASVNVSGLMERFGVEDQTITAGRYKDAGSVLRPQTAEERAILQGVIDDLYERFRSVVARGRPQLGRERVDALADGRLYSAPQALENGLVDRIGDIEDAVLRLEARAGVRSSSVVSYHRSNDWRQNLYTRSPEPPSGRAPSDVWTLVGVPSPGFHYLWWPGATSR